MKTKQDSITEEMVEDFFKDYPQLWQKIAVKREDVQHLLRRYRTALIEQIEREVLGEDEISEHYNGPDSGPIFDEQAGLRNELRAEQRAKLTALRKEV